MNSKRNGRVSPAGICCFVANLFAIVSALGCSDENMRITEKSDGQTVKLIATLDHCVDVTVSLRAALRNLDATPKLPLMVDSNGRRSFELVTLRIHDADAEWSYDYHYDWKPGGRGGGHNPAQVYALPYGPKSTHELIQGYLGQFSHQRGSQDEYALDWEMPIGSTISACRPGTVVGVRSDSNEGGPTKAFEHCANYIILKHSDGTYAEYLHLQQNGALVKIGDKVVTGSSLAHSGSTGFSSRPHLHFAVFRTINGELRETIPTKFRTKSGKVETLHEGISY